MFDRLRDLVKRPTGQLSLQGIPTDDIQSQRTKSHRPTARTLPRLAIGPAEAAEMLGVSRDFFDEHIKPELRIVRRGSRTILIPVAELERWLQKSAARCSV